MKAHIGVDAKSGLVHRVRATAVHVSDLSQARHLLHGQEKEVHANAGYQVVEKHVPAEVAAAIEWQVAVKRGRIKALAEGLRKQVWRELERRKAQVRSRVEHPFHILKNLFRYRKVRYRGLAKNLAQLHRLFALANLFMARRLLQRAALA